MKYRRSLTVLSVCILALMLAAALTGIFSVGGPGRQAFTTVRGQSVTLYGVGLYRNDSVSMAAQAIAQDAVTVLLGVPMLIVSLVLFRRGTLKGKILLTGTLAYVLYTYMSYSFTSMYNGMFLVYVALMSMSLFAFVLSMMSFNLEEIGRGFGPKLPVRSTAAFLIFVGLMLALMWLGKIAPTFRGLVPAGLDQYTTLVIQAMDLGFIVPAAFLSAVLLMRRRPFGLLLSSVICVKGVTMLTAITAMIVGQLIEGVKVAVPELILFPAVNLAVIVLFVRLMSSIRDPRNLIGKEATAQ